MNIQAEISSVTSEQPSRFALVNGRIAQPDAIVAGQALIVDGNKIGAVLPADQVDATTPRIDVEGRLISPGLIDLHIHGAQQHAFNEATEPAFNAVLTACAQRGITSVLATTVTDTIDNLVTVLDFAQEWMDDAAAAQQTAPTRAQLLGVHVEGPYFAQSQRGAQDPAHIRNPDDGTVDRLLAYHQIIRVFTYAPELPGALALTNRLRDLDIVAAAGHSAAREEDVKPCMDAGLRHMIHLWSGQSTTTREGPWRKPGLLEVALTDERLSGEIIADGKHLPPTLMKLAYRCLGPERLCIISDATSGAGLADGTRYRMGGMEYEVCDGVGMLLDRTAFAGSTTLLNQMLPVLTGQVGIPLADVIRMASLTPAQVIGVAERKGSLETGKDADIAIFNADFTVWRTLIGGRWVDSA